MPDIINTTHDNSSDEDSPVEIKTMHRAVEAEDAAVVSGGSEEGDPEPERLRAASNDDDGVDEPEAPARGESSANLESGRWSAAEHARFVDGLQRFGRRKWIRIAEHVGTRTVIQVRSHAQKYFKKLRRTASTNSLRSLGESDDEGEGPPAATRDCATLEGLDATEGFALLTAAAKLVEGAKAHVRPDESGDEAASSSLSASGSLDDLHRPECDDSRKRGRSSSSEDDDELAAAAESSKRAAVAVSPLLASSSPRVAAPLLPAPLGCPVVSAATTPEARLDDSRYSRLGGFALESH